MKYLTLLFLLIAVYPARPQTTVNGETKGPCSPAVIGSNSTVTLSCPGLSKEELATFKNLLNKLLVNQLTREEAMDKFAEVLNHIDKLEPNNSYGNLRTRCLLMGDALLKYADSRRPLKPPVTNKDDLLNYNEWWKENDFGLRRTLFDDIIKLHDELSAIHEVDHPLDRLLNDAASKYKQRQQNVPWALEMPQAYFMSIDDIAQMGYRFKSLANDLLEK